MDAHILLQDGTIGQNRSQKKPAFMPNTTVFWFWLSTSNQSWCINLPKEVKEYTI
jgi:hypothetical protein